MVIFLSLFFQMTISIVFIETFDDEKKILIWKGRNINVVALWWLLWNSFSNVAQKCLSKVFAILDKIILISKIVCFLSKRLSAGYAWEQENITILVVRRDKYDLLDIEWFETYHSIDWLGKRQENKWCDFFLTLAFQKAKPLWYYVNKVWLAWSWEIQLIMCFSKTSHANLF